MPYSKLLAIREYSELRQLQQTGIGGRLLQEASSAVTALDPRAEEASPALDRLLLQAAQANPDPKPMLALRCRVSHPLEAWLQGTHARFREHYGIDLLEMASYGLDDDGRQTIRNLQGEVVPLVYAEVASRAKGLISPFTAEVLRTYDPSRCGLPHWARLKLQAHNGLKAYFREHGLLLISDWALLRHSSGLRVREACERFLSSDASMSTVIDLHKRYLCAYDSALDAYRVRTGKGSGWQPDCSFLEELVPEREASQTHALLLGMARAVRTFLSGQWLRTSSLDDERSDVADPNSQEEESEDDATPAAQMELIRTALQRAMDQHMPSVLSAGKDSALLHALWSGWAEGLSNRPLAERCRTTCGTVSKKLRPTEHATAIATAAAVELKRHPLFSSCFTSVAATEQLVAALKNHLLEPEREGEVSPLRRWIRQALHQS